MIKRSLLSILLLAAVFSVKAQEATMRTSLWLGIWDNVLHVPAMKITAIGYNDIPRDIPYKGVLVEVLEFDDANGHNILILTQTGKFPVSAKSAEGKYEKLNDRAELFAYCYVTNPGTNSYRLLWKTADAQDCEEFDLYCGYTKKSLSITDLDGDGIAEVCFQHVKSCRSDVSPADRILLMYETNSKFSIMGITTLEGMTSEQPMIDARLNDEPLFKAHMEKQWKAFESDDFIQFN